LEADPYRSTAIQLPRQRAMPTYPSAYDQENSMLDIVMLALGLGFFVVAVGYTYACERL
jgi:hypothetical protein